MLAVLFVQMLPAEGLFIAQYKMMASLHLLDTVIGVSIIYVAAVVPFTIWMLRGFVAGIPADLEEAAMVDGLSRFGAFMRITFPLLAPGLVASGVYAFLQAWNEFTVALVLLPSEAVQTLPLWLRGFVQASATRETDWGQVMAASTLVAIPVIIFFLIVQGRLTSGPRERGGQGMSAAAGDRACAPGIDIGGTKTDAVAVLEDGRVGEQLRLPTGFGPEPVLETAVAAVLQLAEQSGMTVARLRLDRRRHPRRGRHRHRTRLPRGEPRPRRPRPRRRAVRAARARRCASRTT